MKCYTYIDKEHDEEVLIYAHEKSKLVLDIENIVKSSSIEIKGVYNDEIVIINPIDVCCFLSEANKVYALIGDKKYQIKYRLYQLEEMELNKNFIKINQSCYANIKRIKKFESTISGALKVIFNNGYVDYIARRELKNVKERMGL